MPNINIVATFSAGGDFNNVDGLVLFRLTEKTQQRLSGWTIALHHLIYPKVGDDSLTSARIDGLGHSEFIATHLTQDDLNGDEFPELPEALMDDQWLAISDEYYDRLRAYLLDESHHLIRARDGRFRFGTYGVALSFVEKHAEHLEIEPNFRLDYINFSSGNIQLNFPKSTFTPSK